MSTFSRVSQQGQVQVHGGHVVLAQSYEEGCQGEHSSKLMIGSLDMELLRIHFSGTRT